MAKFKKMVSFIPNRIVENTIIVTDINDGLSAMEFHNADLSLTTDQKEQYDWKFATVDGFRDEYEDKKKDGYFCVFMLGYKTMRAAKIGHVNLVKHIKKYGMKFAGSDDDEVVRSIATGKWKGGE